jgi:hypothetical protein
VQLIARAAAACTNATLLSYLEHDTKLPVAPIEGWRLDIRKNLDLKPRHRRASQYSDLILGNPGAFRLPAGLLSVFESPYEVFLRTP